MEEIVQKKGLQRNTIDKFYTKKNIVKLCMDLIKNNINILDTDLIIEPSAGNGSFIEEIKKLSKNYNFYDLEPEHHEIIKKDFLKLELNKIGKIHIIGNPPFGRQSSLAIQFIKKSCEFADSISFVLPKSFKKDSMRKYFSSYFHLISEIDLPYNSFMVNDKEHDVPCIFQVWELREYPRKKIKKLEPLFFKFVKKENVPDISFRRVGVNAGRLSKNITDKSIQSHYFIKFTNDKSIDDNLKLLQNIKFEFNNTVGPKSISKQELIKEFNKLQLF